MKNLITEKMIPTAGNFVKPRLTDIKPLTATKIRPAGTHHTRPYIVVRAADITRENPPCVPERNRFLKPDMLNKHWYLIERFITNSLHYTKKGVYVIKKLLRYWSYYGACYPRAEDLAPEYTPKQLKIYAEVMGKPWDGPKSDGVSVRHFWRIVDELEADGLIERINRYVEREEAQISDWYKLNNLLVLIASYLRDHFVSIEPEWLNEHLDRFGPRHSALLSVPVYELDYYT